MDRWKGYVIINSIKVQSLIYPDTTTTTKKKIFLQVRECIFSHRLLIRPQRPSDLYLDNDMFTGLCKWLFPNPFINNNKQLPKQNALARWYRLRSQNYQTGQNTKSSLKEITFVRATVAERLGPSSRPG